MFVRSDIHEGGAHLLSPPSLLPALSSLSVHAAKLTGEKFSALHGYRTGHLPSWDASAPTSKLSASPKALPVVDEKKTTNKHIYLTNKLRLSVCPDIVG